MNQQPPSTEWENARSEPLDGSASGETPGRPVWRARWIILGVILLVAGPVAYREFPREVSRWYVAAAENARRSGDNEEALRLLDQAFAWDATSRAARLEHARLSQAKGDMDAALNDFAVLLEKDPHDIALRITRANMLMQSQRFEQAVREWQEVERLSAGESTERRAMVLNGLAYCRAVGNLELEQGLQDIELAIKLVGSNAAMIDTRGYLHYRLGNYKLALADLNEAVEKSEKELEGARSEWRHSVAVIRYHRALLHDALDKSALADEDRRRVRELGFEPGEELF